MSGDARYLKLLDEMRELHIKKNAGYAGDSTDRWANFRMSEAFNVSAFKGCLVRMSDKYIRVQNILKNPNNEQVGEAVRDTLMDLAAYALIAICLMEEQENKSQFGTSWPKKLEFRSMFPNATDEEFERVFKKRSELGADNED